MTKGHLSLGGWQWEALGSALYTKALVSAVLRPWAVMTRLPLVLELGSWSQ